MNHIWQLLWQSFLLLFLPILAANQAGMIARAFNLPLGERPVSVRWFGKNKTWAPYYVAPVSVWVIFFLYGAGAYWLQALIIGIGTVLGDHVKSFVKRRLGYPEGYKCLPDRIDFALGGGFAAWLVIKDVTLWHVAVVVLMALPTHYIGNYIGYRLGWRETPH